MVLGALPWVRNKGDLTLRSAALDARASVALRSEYGLENLVAWMVFTSNLGALETTELAYRL
jgi:hypothetical protein